MDLVKVRVTCLHDLRTHQVVQIRREFYHSIVRLRASRLTILDFAEYLWVDESGSAHCIPIGRDYRLEEIPQ